MSPLLTDVQSGREFDMFRDACRDRAIQAASARVPSPQILMFKVSQSLRVIAGSLSQEGSSEARWLVCRLIPSHKVPISMCRRVELTAINQDTASQQLASFPQLGYMTEPQRRMLVDKFLGVPTDEPSFELYYSSLFK